MGLSWSRPQRFGSQHPHACYRGARRRGGRRCDCPRHIRPALLGGRASIDLPARNEPARYYYRCDAEAVSCQEPTCQSVRGDIPDSALACFTVEVLNRESINLALAVREQVVADFAAADAQRARRIEGLRCEADLARRRLFEVDPANRLVAAALEADWNERLRALQDACREREERAATREEEISADRTRRIRELSRDFARVWDAPGTGNSDRKRLIGLLIEDVTLTRDGYELRADVRLRGGKVVALGPLPLPRPHRIASPIAPETVAVADKLLDGCNDSETAGELNLAGHASGDGKPWTARRVQWLRQCCQLPSHAQRRRRQLAFQGYMAAKELAGQLYASHRRPCAGTRPKADCSGRSSIPAAGLSPCTSSAAGADRIPT